MRAIRESLTRGYFDPNSVGLLLGREGIGGRFNLKVRTTIYVEGICPGASVFEHQILGPIQSSVKDSFEMRHHETVG